MNERIYVQLTGTRSAPQLVFNSDSRGTSDELQHLLMADFRNDPSNVATTVVENVFTDLGYLDSITIDPSTVDVSGGPQSVDVTMDLRNSSGGLLIVLVYFGDPHTSTMVGFGSLVVGDSTDLVPGMRR